MNTLVDSSAWIDYFRGSGRSPAVDFLIEENLVSINDLILAELIPPLRLRRQRRLIALLQEVRRYPVEIDWNDIVELQVVCLRKGINGVGLPDLIIAQNAMQHGLHLLTSDRHFDLISRHRPLSLYGD